MGDYWDTADRVFDLSGIEDSPGCIVKTRYLIVAVLLLAMVVPIVSATIVRINATETDYCAWSGTNVNWMDAHDATDYGWCGGTSTFMLATIVSGGTSSKWNEIDRGFSSYLTNSSTIPAGATINGIVIRTRYAWSQNDFSNLNLTLRASYPTNPLDFTPHDYYITNIGSTDLSNRISIPTSGDGNFTLTAGGVAIINRSGYTSFAMMLSKDADNIAPTWSASKTTTYETYGYGSAVANLNYMEVNYTLPAANSSIASFTKSRTLVTIPEDLQVNDTSSNVPTSWDWYFGDSTANVTTQNATHYYSTPGNYTIMLTATNSAGSNSTSQTIQVNAAPTTTPTQTPTPTTPPTTTPTTSPTPTPTPIPGGQWIIFTDNITQSSITWNLSNKALPLTFVSLDGIALTGFDPNATIIIQSGLTGGETHSISAIANNTTATATATTRTSAGDTLINLVSDWFPVFIILGLFAFGVWLHWLIFFIGSGVSLYFLYDWIQRYPIQTVGIGNLHFLVYAALFILGLILWLFKRKGR
jgi:PKD repeat protein